MTIFNCKANLQLRKQSQKVMNLPILYQRLTDQVLIHLLGETCMLILPITLIGT